MRHFLYGSVAGTIAAALSVYLWMRPALKYGRSI
jgi:hypothetical protein